MHYYFQNSIKCTEAFNTYWKFACERQNIFYKKFHGVKQPWTNDEILLNYKFTNTYRASDRVSQYLIKNVIYDFKGNEEDLLFRILLFKFFNKIETWELIEKSVGIIDYSTYERKHYSKIIDEIYTSNKALYSGAYIMPSGKREFGNDKKFENHLDLIELMFNDHLLLKINNCHSLKDLYLLLLQYPTIGTFLAYQYSIDINYSELCNFSEMEFVVAGPGAKSGIKKCFYDIGRYNESDIIRYMAENQCYEFASRNLDFKNLWGRDLQLIDCQNLFCEVDKYSRIAHPNIEGLHNRMRIKQKYHYNNTKLNLYYPPKWNIKIT